MLLLVLGPAAAFILQCYHLPLLFMTRHYSTVFLAAKQLCNPSTWKSFSVI